MWNLNKWNYRTQGENDNYKTRMLWNKISNIEKKNKRE